MLSPSFFVRFLLLFLSIYWRDGDQLDYVMPYPRMALARGSNITRIQYVHASGDRRGLAPRPDVPLILAALDAIDQLQQRANMQILLCNDPFDFIPEAVSL